MTDVRWKEISRSRGARVYAGYIKRKRVFTIYAFAKNANEIRENHLYKNGDIDSGKFEQSFPTLKAAKDFAENESMVKSPLPLLLLGAALFAILR